MSGPSSFKEVCFLVGMYKVPLEGGGLYQLEPQDKGVKKQGF